jgi:hypothetical protein
MAPTTNKTNLVATAMATFVSIDKLIIFATPVLIFPFLGHFEFQRGDGCQDSGRGKSAEGAGHR